ELLEECGRRRARSRWLTLTQQCEDRQEALEALEGAADGDRPVGHLEGKVRAGLEGRVRLILADPVIRVRGVVEARRVEAGRGALGTATAQGLQDRERLENPRKLRPGRRGPARAPRQRAPARPRALDVPPRLQL